VYIIQDTATGLYKIGRTGNMSRRMKELGVGKSARLVSQHHTSNAAALESAAHRRYKNQRLPQTEYFRLSAPPII
jgi:predicted GIY-YIG superfamily endonuclease